MMRRKKRQTNKQTNSPSLPELECFSVSTLDLQPLAGLYFSFLFYILVFGGRHMMFTPQPLPFEMETVTSLVVPTDMCRCKEKGCVHVCVCLCLNWRDFEGRQRKVIIEGPLFIFRCSAVVCFMITAPRRGNLSKKKFKIMLSIFVFTFYWANLRTLRFCSFMYVNCCQSWLKPHIHGLTSTLVNAHVQRVRPLKGKADAATCVILSVVYVFVHLGALWQQHWFVWHCKLQTSAKRKNRVDVRRVKKNIRGEGEEKKMAETKEGQKEGRGESERKWKGRKWRSKMSKGHKCAGSVCACGAGGGRGRGVTCFAAVVWY